VEPVQGFWLGVFMTLFYEESERGPRIGLGTAIYTEGANPIVMIRNIRHAQEGHLECN